MFPQAWLQVGLQYPSLTRMDVPVFWKSETNVLWETTSCLACSQTLPDLILPRAPPHPPNGILGLKETLRLAMSRECTQAVPDTMLDPSHVKGIELQE